MGLVRTCEEQSSGKATELRRAALRAPDPVPIRPRIPAAARVPRLCRFFVKRDRGSSALARPQLPLVPPGLAALRLKSPLHKPDAAAADAAATTVGAKEPPRPSVRAVPDRVQPRSSSAPFAAASRPVADWGWGGEAHLTCALRRARAEGCGWGYGSRKAPITPALPIPEHNINTSHTPDGNLVLGEESVWLV